MWTPRGFKYCENCSRRVAAEGKFSSDGDGAAAASCRTSEHNNSIVGT